MTDTDGEGAIEMPGLRERTELRDRLLEAALLHAPFDGWCKRTLKRGARDAGIEPGLAQMLFPGGADDLVDHLDDWADRRMLERVETEDFSALPVRRRIEMLVRARLEVLEPHREAVRRAAAARLLPVGGLRAGRGTWRTADRMWTAVNLPAGSDAGSTFYTRRLLLAGVLVSTFLFWLDDTSKDHQRSWAFLERQIDQVLRLGRHAGRFTIILDRLPFPRRRGAASRDRYRSETRGETGGSAGIGPGAPAV